MHRCNSFSQTLTKVDLYNNNIGQTGTEYLANALRTNTVALSFRSIIARVRIRGSLFGQTLLHLELDSNNIEAVGAQYLANALEHNKVVKCRSIAYVGSKTMTVVAFRHS